MSNRTNSKKLYAIKKTKTGRNSIVQVLNTSKGKVYASTKRKIGSNTKTFKTKLSAQKHLKESSFGRKDKRAPKNEGYIACVNPDLDEEKPNSYFKVFKVYTYKIGDEKVRIFNSKTDNGNQQFWRLPDDEDSPIKVRKYKHLAKKDRIKLGRLKNANLLHQHMPLPCSEEYLNAIGQSSFFNIESNGETYPSGKGIKLPPAYASLMNTKYIPTGDGSQIRIGQKSPSTLEQVFGLDPSVHGMTPELLNKIRKRENLGNTSSSDIRNALSKNLSRRKYSTEGSDIPYLNDTRELPFFKNDSNSNKNNSFGHNQHFGKIPNFGKYSYPVDPALKRLIAQSNFGFRRGGYGNSFGRINYGFSRYF